MRKLIMLLIIVSSLFAFNICLANDKLYLNEDILKYIIFDYEYLTKIDEDIIYKYFEELKNNMFNENFINKLDLNSSTLEECILEIQLNYKNIISKMNDKEKEVLDKYLLDCSLKYYYQKLGEEFDYEEYEKVYKDFNEEELLSTSSNFVTISICSDPSSDFNNNSGFISTGLQSLVGHHSWITLTNISGKDLYFGGLRVPNGRAVSMGTWQGKNHDGIYYNLESYFNEVKGEFSKEQSVFLSQYLTESQFNKLNSKGFISEYDIWNVGQNCSYFAAKMWNMNNQNDEVSAGIIPNPKSLAESIMERGGTRGALLIAPYGYGVYYGVENPTMIVTI